MSRSEQLVRTSKVLAAPAAGARTKKDLFEAIRREVEYVSTASGRAFSWWRSWLKHRRICIRRDEVLNEAVKAAWEILTTSTRCGGDVSELIDRHAHEALCDIYEARAEQQHGHNQPQQ